METFLQVLLMVSCLFLILLILVQRGRGGGLAGAFGGMGGQSAFGTKAGDTFTRITIVAAVVWILLCIVSIRWINSNHSEFGSGPTAPVGTSGVTSPATGKGNAGNMPGANDAGNGGDDSSPDNEN
jgi:preprotein translocase subunit SecG